MAVEEAAVEGAELANKATCASTLRKLWAKLIWENKQNQLLGGGRWEGARRGLGEGRLGDQSWTNLMDKERKPGGGP